MVVPILFLVHIFDIKAGPFKLFPLPCHQVTHRVIQRNQASGSSPYLRLPTLPRSIIPYLALAWNILATLCFPVVSVHWCSMSWWPLPGLEDCQRGTGQDFLFGVKWSDHIILHCGTYCGSYITNWSDNKQDAITVFIIYLFICTRHIT